MSSENKHIKYSAWDIEQYLSGKLSQLQMHAMEKAALDDPFLSEAMEGYEGMKDKEWNNQLVTLREAIANKGAVAKVIPLHKSKNKWWRVAAAIVILGGGTMTTILITRDKQAQTSGPQIAQTQTITVDSLLPKENAAPASVTASLNPTASATTEDIKTNTVLAKVEPVTEQDQYIPESGAPELKAINNNATASTIITEKITVPAPPPPASNNIGAGNNSEQIADEFNLAKKSASKPNNEADGFAKKSQLNNFFTAQVVAPDNTPLPFTNISIKKENFGTYADAKGMVRLVSTDSILNIEVRSVGYQPKTFSLRNNQAQTKIVLQEDQLALKEKTVVGNATVASNQKSRRATLVTDSVVNVEPADGWDNYNTYVANNLDIPAEMLRKDIRGEVELSFDVKSNGTISNIRVNKSLGAEYDEAAKRLILEGPQWKVKKGRKTSAKVKVQF